MRERLPRLGWRVVREPSSWSKKRLPMEAVVVASWGGGSGKGKDGGGGVKKGIGGKGNGRDGGLGNNGGNGRDGGLGNNGGNGKGGGHGKPNGGKGGQKNKQAFGVEELSVSAVNLVPHEGTSHDKDELETRVARQKDSGSWPSVQTNPSTGGISSL
ncbi:uncharacterized protein A4U43_C09F14240 [Asparagus officinalis]|uniref:Uncharacterized protein n=1 Tax=Asparagus officinalis TaxID=4686 RepID=A0A5P1E7E0_ASPOF|nr:uncharacterized protein A4U43_C09F14240 [Asparagus officinalis]